MNKPVSPKNIISKELKELWDGLNQGQGSFTGAFIACCQKFILDPLEGKELSEDDKVVLRNIFDLADDAIRLLLGGTASMGLVIGTSNGPVEELQKIGYFQNEVSLIVLELSAIQYEIEHLLRKDSERTTSEKGGQS